MIYAFSVIKGLNSLRGNMFVHLSVAIAMLSFVRIPNASSWFRNEKEDEIEEFPASEIWYVYAAALHFLTAIHQFFDMMVAF